MEAASNGYNVGHARIALTIVGGWEMITEVGEIANDALVEVGEVVVSKGISIKSCGIGASFEQRADLVAFEAMIVIGVVKATWSRRRNSGNICERISCWRTIGK